MKYFKRRFFKSRDLGTGNVKYSNLLGFYWFYVVLTKKATCKVQVSHPMTLDAYFHVFNIDLNYFFYHDFRGEIFHKL